MSSFADPRCPVRTWLFRFVLLAAVCIAGCASLSGGTSALQITSRRGGTVFQPSWSTAVYRAIDSNTADIYLTDLPPETFDHPPDPAASFPSGSILAVRMFLAPKAGRTPIDFTASNMTVTHVILTPEAAGLYGGGGFMLPSTRVGGRTFSGRISRATIAPFGSATTSSQVRFVDRLGQSELSGRISARLDDQAAQRIGSWLTALIEDRFQQHSN